MTVHPPWFATDDEDVQAAHLQVVVTLMTSEERRKPLRRQQLLACRAHSGLHLTRHRRQHEPANPHALATEAVLVRVVLVLPHHAARPFVAVLIATSGNQAELSHVGLGRERASEVCSFEHSARTLDAVTLLRPRFSRESCVAVWNLDQNPLLMKLRRCC